MAKVKSKAVTTTTNEYGLSENRPDHVGNQQRGGENIGADDLTIPRLSLIQDLSPQRKKNQPEYIDGAEEGMFFNSVSNQLYGTEILFIPVFFRKEYLVWMDREKGGGLMGVFPTEAEAEAGRQELDEADDCEVVENANQFGMLMHKDGSLEDIVISMSKSQLTPSRKLNSMISMAEAGDRWSKAYLVSSFEQDGKKGAFYNFKFHPMGFVPESAYKRGEKLYDSIASGVKDVNREPTESEATESDEM